MKSNKLLIVIDYQNDFVNGSLGFADAINIESGIIDKIKEFEATNDDIIFTLDTHQSDYLDTIEGQHLPIHHCIEGSKGHQIYGKAFPYSLNHQNIKKDTFGSKDLFEFLRNKLYDEIQLCGVVTNICVISNAIICKTVLPNTRIVILKELCASNDPLLAEKSFEILKNLHMEVK